MIYCNSALLIHTLLAPLPPHHTIPFRFCTCSRIHYYIEYIRFYRQWFVAASLIIGLRPTTAPIAFFYIHFAVFRFPPRKKNERKIVKFHGNLYSILGEIMVCHVKWHLKWFSLGRNIGKMKCTLLSENKIKFQWKWSAWCWHTETGEWKSTIMKWNGCDCHIACKQKIIEIFVHAFHLLQPK